MAIQRKHRGFTRLDALVVAAVCLAFVLLVPVLHAMTQEHYFRTVCAARIAEIGETMFVYANDNETALPRAGGPTTMSSAQPANEKDSLLVHDPYGVDFSMPTSRN